MSADQTTAELTTRDVLLQVDRRLTLIEEDLRSLDDKLDDKVDGLAVKLDSRIEGLRTKMDNGFEALGAKLDVRLDSHLKWTIGTLVALTGLVVAVFKL